MARHAVETRAVLNTLTDPSDLLRRLLEGGHSVVAGRICGALWSMGRGSLADEIRAAMKSAGYVIHEANPFAGQASGGAVAVFPIADRWPLGPL